MPAECDRLLTITDVGRDPRLAGFSARQIEYAVREAKIEPVGRLGIIRAFSANQIPLILSAVRRGGRRGAQSLVSPPARGRPFHAGTLEPADSPGFGGR